MKYIQYFPRLLVECRCSGWSNTTGWWCAHCRSVTGAYIKTFTTHSVGGVHRCSLHSSQNVKNTNSLPKCKFRIFPQYSVINRFLGSLGINTYFEQSIKSIHFLNKLIYTKFYMIKASFSNLKMTSFILSTLIFVHCSLFVLNFGSLLQMGWTLFQNTKKCFF